MVRSVMEGTSGETTILWPGPKWKGWCCSSVDKNYSGDTFWKMDCKDLIISGLRKLRNSTPPSPLAQHLGRSKGIQWINYPWVKLPTSFGTYTMMPTPVTQQPLHTNQPVSSSRRGWLEIRSQFWSWSFFQMHLCSQHLLSSSWVSGYLETGWPRTRAQSLCEFIEESKFPVTRRKQMVLDDLLLAHRRGHSHTEMTFQSLSPSKGVKCGTESHEFWTSSCHIYFDSYQEILEIKFQILKIIDATRASWDQVSGPEESKVTSGARVTLQEGWKLWLWCLP